MSQASNDNQSSIGCRPGDRVSEYVLESLIGAGTFGEVWRARHHIWSEQVAIKFPTQPEYVRHLQREGTVVHGLRHANVVRVQGFDPYAERPYLVMELVDGPSLRDVIDRHREGLDRDVVSTLMRGVLSAIQAAHTNGVLHRDLKPSNVLLNLGDRALEEVRSEDVKVVDFGLGVGVDPSGVSMVHSASLAADTRLVGTLPYIAPEMRDHGEEATPKSDLYAIGVMLFELLTGSRPAGAELPSTMRADATEFDELFQRLYARVDRRLATAEAALALLPRDARAPAMQVTSVATTAVGNARAVGLLSCNACHTPAEPGDQYCTQCGARLADEVRCPQCAAYPAPDDRYCIYCGTQVRASA